MEMAFIILIILAMAILATSMRVVKEYERIVVLRFGHFIRIMGPGLVLLVPLLTGGKG